MLLAFDLQFQKLYLQLSNMGNTMSTLLSGPDLSTALDRVDLSSVRNARFEGEGIVVSLTSWQTRSLDRSWKQLQTNRHVGLLLLSALFARHPSSQSVFGLAAVTRECALADSRVQRQALILTDTICNLSLHHHISHSRYSNGNR